MRIRRWVSYRILSSGACGRGLHTAGHRVLCTPRRAASGGRTAQTGPPLCRRNAAGGLRGLPHGGGWLTSVRLLHQGLTSAAGLTAASAAPSQDSVQASACRRPCQVTIGTAGQRTALQHKRARGGYDHCAASHGPDGTWCRTATRLFWTHCRHTPTASANWPRRPGSGRRRRAAGLRTAARRRRMELTSARRSHPVKSLALN